MEPTALLIILAIFLVAVLYSSVGHGGASGYLAVMALLAVAPEITRPTALTLNVVVSAIAFAQFAYKGGFSWRVFWPFAVASIPMAYVGGTIDLPTSTYKIVLGIVLIFTAVRLSLRLSGDSDHPTQPPIAAALAVGAAIGFVSGLVGVGGGIFLTPVLLLMKWSETRVAAGVSALFILLNSGAALAGSYSKVAELPEIVWAWLAAALIGGVIGATLGSNKFGSLTLRRVLAVVLVAAGIKLIFV